MQTNRSFIGIGLAGLGRDMANHVLFSRMYGKTILKHRYT